MKRTAEKFMNSWLKSESRKPLVIRGARQVGKTWLVRQIAKHNDLQLIELNLEQNPRVAALFASNDPERIMLSLSATLNLPPTLEKGLLFLDEIQAAPELLAKLRWFAEELPQLPVVVAGSLLEFVLADHTFSMPVGRISYMHLEPLTFEEFLLAQGKTALHAYLNSWLLDEAIPAVLHETLLEAFKEYVIIGGMPAAVSTWCSNKNFASLSQRHYDLLATYRDDFAKYRGKIALENFDEVMMAVPRQLGQKFMYTKVNRNVSVPILKNALDLICKARICHSVTGSAANGIPLGAELIEKHQKMVFLDVGLCSTALGISLNQVTAVDELTLVNNGALAEQVTGQILRTILPEYIEPRLYYWQREEKGSSAEIDYLIQYGNTIFPIEVKAGKTGSLKSLHLFMHLKKLKSAIRINSDLPSITPVNIKLHDGTPVTYQLLSLPFYMLTQLPRLLTKTAS